ncbi:MAG: hypothetical protein V1807_02335 [Patescibacteria group bacterium]
MKNQLHSGSYRYLSNLSGGAKTQPVKIILIAIGVVAVILIVLFNRQIGELLNLFGSRAALETGNIVLDSNNFLSSGYEASIYDPVNGTWTPNNTAVGVNPENRLVIIP